MKLFLYRSFFIACCILAYTAASSQSKLFFREDWKEILAATPVTQEHVANPNLILTLYGPAKDQIKKSNHPPIPNDPYYIWSGDCKGNWAFTLSYRDKWVDLTGNAKINLRTRQSGFRQLHLILKLSTGDWMVSDQSVGYTPDWAEKEFKIADLSWRKLNIETVTEGNPVKNPDLSKIIEIGFTDLMPGGGTPASSRVDWIEVYGKKVSKK
jgi:hypothetical protein